MKILIFEDDKKFINQLQCDLTQYFLQHEMNFEIIIKLDNFAQYEIDDNSTNIIFMDIDLIQANGINIAKQIKNKYPQSILIIVSSRNDLVFDTLSVGIFQFIRKSHYNIDFKKVMNELTYYLDDINKHITLIINGRKRKIYMKDIKYILSIGRDTTICCYKTNMTIRASFKHTLETLDFPELVQIQRALAVNVRYIDKVNLWDIQCENNTFHIGRKYQKQFIQNYESYILK